LNKLNAPKKFVVISDFSLDLSTIKNYDSYQNNESTKKSIEDLCFSLKNQCVEAFTMEQVREGKLLDKIISNLV